MLSEREIMSERVRAWVYTVTGCFDFVQLYPSNCTAYDSSLPSLSILGITVHCYNLSLENIFPFYVS